MCSENALEGTINLSKNTALTRVDCNSNKIETLDISGCSLLESISCYSNQLTSLDISKNTKLKGLNCDDNPLSTLFVWWGGGSANVPTQLSTFYIPDGVSFVKK